MRHRLIWKRASFLIAIATAAACGNPTPSSSLPRGIGAANWPWRYDMVNQPSAAVASQTQSPSGETMSVRSELPVSRERADLRLQNPIPTEAPVDAGRALYGVYCSPCHGIDAAGDGVVAPYFGSIPDLTSAEMQQHGDGWFYATITNGTERMPRYISELTPEERWQIVHFLRTAGTAR
jgi:mono/diheme cytochrome c family protein